MGLMFGLALTGFLVYLGYAFVMNPAKRRKLVAEFHAEPTFTIAVMVWVGFLMIFFWGILIPPFGAVKVSLGATVLPLWQVGGLGVLVGGVVGLVWEEVAKRK